MEFWVIDLPFCPAIYRVLLSFPWYRWTSCPERGAAGHLIGEGLGVFGRYEASQGQIGPGAEGTHPQSFSQISNRFEKNSGT